ncbi:hypothetical protein C9374_012922 [Naegleria lovaniensis]|uniref:Uncharacterized protein n=1 Tax=Naegleria lovaniensis TaxID=51637 RepID=A0AA88GAQ7_NAELO|nr:uncharacterized protein C9374_012922 [Naegleria lovaniensis]KAG2373076.1 hypothetical protein C9374_012922 [Naegleria lovaniensis]
MPKKPNQSNAAGTTQRNTSHSHTSSKKKKKQENEKDNDDIKYLIEVQKKNEKEMKQKTTKKTDHNGDQHIGNDHDDVFEDFPKKPTGLFTSNLQSGLEEFQKGLQPPQKVQESDKIPKKPIGPSIADIQFKSEEESNIYWKGKQDLQQRAETVFKDCNGKFYSNFGNRRFFIVGSETLDLVTGCVKELMQKQHVDDNESTTPALETDENDTNHKLEHYLVPKLPQIDNLSRVEGCYHFSVHTYRSQIAFHLAVQLCRLLKLPDGGVKLFVETSNNWAITLTEVVASEALLGRVYVVANTTKGLEEFNNYTTQLMSKSGGKDGFFNLEEATSLCRKFKTDPSINWRDKSAEIFKLYLRHDQPIRIV